MATEKVSDVLRREHRLIEKVLAVLERFADDPAAGSCDAWDKAIEFIREFADRCHHLKEEKILFPALEGHGISAAGGPLGVMIEEHELGRAHLQAMRQALERWGNGDEAAKAVMGEKAHAYVRLLREHIRKEDDVLFVMADEALTDAEQKKLVDEFEKHELEEMGAGIHEKYAAIAEDLSRAVGRGRNAR